MPTSPQTLPDQRLYAIGDIHGRVDLLNRLLSMIEADARQFPLKSRKIIFLGDYVDRGLDSRGVLARLIQPMPVGLEAIFLRGNHDDMLMQFLAGDDDVLSGWLQLGGASTLASYGVNPFSAAGQPETLRQALALKVPAEHTLFLENTVFSVTFGDYTFVHAGLRPGVPLSQQTDDDKMWIRGDFLFSDFSFETMVVHGHTIKPEAEIKTNRIGIDTGAFATGHLTCLVLDGAERFQLTT
jgi:serine/threonine protein phosphatase 1